MSLFDENAKLDVIMEQQVSIRASGLLDGFFLGILRFFLRVANRTDQNFGVYAKVNQVFF